MNKFSVIKFAKNVPDIAVTALEIYKIILSVKYFAADNALKAVSLYRKKTAYSEKQPVTSDNVQANEINNDKENKSMKKSTAFVLIAFVAAAAGALVAVAAYLKKKEENLNEYEEMLFNEDYLSDYMPKDEDSCCFDDDCHSEENSECSCDCCDAEKENPEQ